MFLEGRTEEERERIREAIFRPRPGSDPSRVSAAMVEDEMNAFLSFGREVNRL